MTKRSKIIKEVTFTDATKPDDTLPSSVDTLPISVDANNVKDVKITSPLKELISKEQNDTVNPPIPSQSKPEPPQPLVKKRVRKTPAEKEAEKQRRQLKAEENKRKKAQAELEKERRITEKVYQRLLQQQQQPQFSTLRGSGKKRYYEDEDEEDEDEEDEEDEDEEDEYDENDYQEPLPKYMKYAEKIPKLKRQIFGDR